MRSGGDGGGSAGRADRAAAAGSLCSQCCPSPEGSQGRERVGRRRWPRSAPAGGWEAAAEPRAGPAAPHRNINLREWAGGVCPQPRSPGGVMEGEALPGAPSSYHAAELRCGRAGAFWGFFPFFSTGGFKCFASSSFQSLAVLQRSVWSGWSPRRRRWEGTLPAQVPGMPAGVGAAAPAASTWAWMSSRCAFLPSPNRMGSSAEILVWRLY